MTWRNNDGRCIVASSQISPLDDFDGCKPAQKHHRQPCACLNLAPLLIVQRPVSPFGRYQPEMPNGPHNIRIRPVRRVNVTQGRQERRKSPEPSQSQSDQGRSDQKNYQDAFAHCVKKSNIRDGNKQQYPQIQGDDGRGLARVVNAWADLPAALKTAIVAIANTATNKGGPVKPERHGGEIEQQNRTLSFTARRFCGRTR